MRILVSLILLLTVCTGMSAQRADKIRKTLLDPDSKEVLVVAHRGNWRVAPENSIAAIDSAISMKVDVVEIDVQRTKDGKLILMHDNTVNRTTNGEGKIKDMTFDEIRALRLKDYKGNITDHQVPSLEEALLASKGNIMLNLDKAYAHFDEVCDLLDKTDTWDLIIIKGSKPYADVKKDYGRYLEKVVYMPILSLDPDNAYEAVLAYDTNMKPAAYELLIGKLYGPNIKPVQELLKGRSRIWLNTMWAGFVGKLDDAMAARCNPDDVYGYMIDDLGAGMLQTDTPGPMIEYLRSRNLHE